MTPTRHSEFNLDPTSHRIPSAPFFEDPTDHLSATTRVNWIEFQSVIALFGGNVGIKALIKVIAKFLDDELPTNTILEFSFSANWKRRHSIALYRQLIPSPLQDDFGHKRDNTCSVDAYLVGELLKRLSIVTATHATHKKCRVS